MVSRLATVALVATLGATPCYAHLLKVFAFVEGDRIEGSVRFAAGTEAVAAGITVRATDGRILAQLKPDASGAFTFRATEPIDHVIVASTSDGHSAQWTVDAEELIGVVPPTPDGLNPQRTDSLSSKTGSSHSVQAPVDPIIVDQIERAVARQVRPLREALIEYEQRVRLHEILGGIGYILGLAGIALWWRSRGRRQGP
ncbi:MAG: hypothetical protein U9Q81_15815 [Pseudomonadota bacterium]|nr:hypothetical protein [Pseudomonadota bacterium]